MTTRETLSKLPSKLHLSRGDHPIVTLQNEVNKLFTNFFGNTALPEWMRSTHGIFGVTPAMDVTENSKEFRVSAELPGMDAKDVEVTLADGYVTIKGEKKHEEKEEREGYFRHERSFGSFHRVITLPKNANFDKAEATFNKGVLSISLPKKEGAKQKERTLQIKQAA